MGFFTRKNINNMVFFTIFVLSLMLGINFYTEKTQWQSYLRLENGSEQVFYRLFELPNNKNSDLRVIFDLNKQTQNWYFSNKILINNTIKCNSQICSQFKLDGNINNYIFRRYFLEKMDLQDFSISFNYKCKKGKNISLLTQDSENSIISANKLYCSDSFVEGEYFIKTNQRFFDVIFSSKDVSGLIIGNLKVIENKKRLENFGNPVSYNTELLGYNGQDTEKKLLQSVKIINLCDKKFIKSSFFISEFNLNSHCNSNKTSSSLYFVQEIIYKIPTSIMKSKYLKISVIPANPYNFSLPRIVYSNSSGEFNPIFLPCESCSVRASSFFQHPNLAGHSIVSFFTLFLLVSYGNFGVFVPLLATLLSIFWTGSRTALLGFFCSCLLVIWYTLPRRIWKIVLAGILLSCMVFAISFRSFDLGRLNNTNQVEVTRQSVWAVAITDIQTHLFSGISVSEFAHSYAETYPQNANSLVQHAHNFWLQMGVRFGIFGIIGALILTGGILWFAWYFGSWRGIAFVFPFFMMNILDYSLDFVGVWIPLLVGLLYLRSMKLSNGVK